MNSEILQWLLFLGIIILQIWLCSKHRKGLGLILPTTFFVLSLFAMLTVPTTVTTNGVSSQLPGSIGALISTFLFVNSMTFILLIIFYYYVKKRDL